MPSIMKIGLPLFVLCLFSHATDGFAAGNKVTFTFAPLAGREIVYNTTETYRYDIPGKKSVQQTTNSQTILVEKTDGTGSRIRVTIGESRFEEDGALKPVPALDAMTGRNFRLKAGKDGRLQGMEGLAELSKEIQGAFDNPRIREIMAGLFTEEKLKERFTGEWNARIAPYAGMKIAVGESWYGTQEVYMPFIGTVTLYRKATLAGLEKRKGRKAAHIVFSWFSDPSALSETERKVFVDREKTLGNVTNLSQQGIGVLGEGEAWVETDTMTVLHETQRLRGAFAGSADGSNKDKPADAGMVELERTVTGIVK